MTDGEQEKDLKKAKDVPPKSEKAIFDSRTRPGSDDQETDSSKYKRIHETREKEDKRKKKSIASKEVEESIEAIGAYVSGNLSDESNTASLPAPGGESIHNLESAPLSFSNLSNSRPDLSEDSESSNSDSSSDSGEDVEELEEEKTKAIQSNPSTFRKERSFVESFLTVESKDSKDDKTSPDFSSFSFVKAAPTKEKKTKTPPRKPRRIALTTFKRKSPIKNGATSFESANDAHNLDKVTGGDSSKVFESGTLGKEASFDLGLEVRGAEDKKTVSVISTRKSPRKRPGNNLEPKKLQPDQLAEGKEFELQSSPVKTKQPKQTDENTSKKVKTSSKSRTPDTLGSKVPADSKVTLIKSNKEECAAKKRTSSDKSVEPHPKVKDSLRDKVEPSKSQKPGEISKQSLQDSAAANFLKSLEPCGKKMARIPKIPKKADAIDNPKSRDIPEPTRKSSRTSPQKAAPTVTKAVTPKKKRDAKPVNLFETTCTKGTVFAKPSTLLESKAIPIQSNIDQMAASAADILSNLTNLAGGKNAVAATTKESLSQRKPKTSQLCDKDLHDKVASNPGSKSQKPRVVKATEQTPDKETSHSQLAKISKEPEHPQGWKISSFYVFNNKMPFGVFEEDLKDTS